MKTDGRTKRLIDMTGERFGRLVVVRRVENGKYGSMWLCKCDCGNEISVYGRSLRLGHTQSCGCLVKDIFTKHGMYKSRLHKEWRGIKHRCKNPSASHYEQYGGKGIKVCDEWQGENGFVNFMNWAMANGYSDDKSIDRIDPNGNYDSSNCRWVDMQVQSRNRGVKRTNTSGVTGVQLRTDRGVQKWRATIMIDGENISLGSYVDKQDAINARKEAELRYWGWTNIN